MRELSLNILDIAQNSISAGASLITIEVSESSEKNELVITITDNGCGMDSEKLAQVQDPFFTTRTTRKVGMGIPLFKMSAQMTGGSFSITSEPGKGTGVKARYITSSIDFTPLGDVGTTMVLLITMNADRDFIYRREKDGRLFELDTREIKQTLGDVPLSEPDVTEWLREYIAEQTEIISGGINDENISGA